MPHHQIDRAIGQSLRLRDKTLDCTKKKIRNAKLQNETIGLREIEKRRVVRTCGWFLRQAFRSSARRPRAIPPDMALYLCPLLAVWNFSFALSDFRSRLEYLKGAEIERRRAKSLRLLRFRFYPEW
jgi:hypothetical protein